MSFNIWVFSLTQNCGSGKSDILKRRPIAFKFQWKGQRMIDSEIEKERKKKERKKKERKIQE